MRFKTGTAIRGHKELASHGLKEWARILFFLQRKLDPISMEEKRENMFLFCSDVCHA